MNEDDTNGGYKVITDKPKKANKVYKTLMLVILVAFITFFATSIGMYSYFSDKTNDSTAMSLKTFLSDKTDEKTISDKLSEFKKIINEYYLGEVDDKKLEEGAIKGYIEGLEDPYTEYISKDDMEKYTEDLKGNFVGIGVYMIQDEQSGKIRVLSPIKNSPAEKAGIQPGDIIKSVDGVEYSLDQFSEIADNIKGEEGTEVKLEIIRKDEVLNFTVKRENVDINPVEGEVLENNVGYIEFTSFDETTAEAFINKYNELRTRNITSLIIDLRNNGGGIVDQATDIAGCILPKDSTVLYEIDKNKNEKEVKTKTDPIVDVPIVVLVNENTASSSEILAGALKDYGKAKIVGEKTYGKGVIQQLLSLPDGSGIKITCSEYLTPKRNQLNKVGIEPDEKILLPKDVTNVLNVERQKDTQLQKAIEMLK